MLKTPTFKPSAATSEKACDDCRLFELTYRKLLTPEGEEEARAISQEAWMKIDGNAQGEEKKLGVLKFHPVLEPASETRENPEGEGRIYRCRNCGSKWDIFLWRLSGWESASLVETPEERAMSYTHYGPWYNLIDVEGAQCTWNLSDFDFRLYCHVNRQRIPDQVAGILERHDLSGSGSEIRVELSGDLTCEETTRKTLEKSGTSMLRSVRLLTGPPGGRASAGWCDGMAGRIRRRGGKLGLASHHGESFVLQALGAYRFKFESAVFDL